jgi:hypothetical protein
MTEPRSARRWLADVTGIARIRYALSTASCSEGKRKKVKGKKKSQDEDD